MAESKHTSVPWRLQRENLLKLDGIEFLPIIAIDYIGTAIGAIPTGDDECEANALFIVRACNSHYELVEALKAIMHTAESFIGKTNPTMIRAKQALQKAEG